MKISYSRWHTFLNGFWSGYYNNKNIGQAFCQEFGLQDELLLTETSTSKIIDHIWNNYIEEA